MSTVDETSEKHYDDSDSSLLNEGGHGIKRKSHYLRRQQKRWTVLYRLQPLFLVVNVVFSVAIFCTLLFAGRQLEDKPQYNQNGDIFGLTPKFSQRKVTFRNNSAYMPDDPTQFFKHRTHDRWLELAPRGLGYLEIKDSDQYKFTQESLTGFGNKTVYTTSVTHQLHCLHSIVEAYSFLSMKVNGLVADDANFKMWHVNHCVDYLRQSIMCCGDTAIEGRATTFDSAHSEAASDGWGVTHVCRDYGEIKEWLDAHRVEDRLWI